MIHFEDWELIPREKWARPTLAVPVTQATGEWIAIKMPRLSDGTFGADLDSGGKHQMMAFNPLNKRMYVNGGDYNGAGSVGSYRQMTFSFSLPDLIADPTHPEAHWIIEHPECGGGAVQPKHPDFTGWFFDSKRSVFWMVPGDMLSTSSGNCAGETATNVSDPGFDKDSLMTFDPATKLWKSMGSKVGSFSFNNMWFSIYDAAKDRILRPYYRNTMVMDELQVTPWIWTTKVFVPARPTGADTRFDHSYLAFDAPNRKMYAISNNLLYRLDVDTWAFESLGAVPKADTGGENKIVWDSVNNVLIYHAYPYDWFAYKSAARAWETLPNLTANGLTASGRIMGFDPSEGAVMIWGQNLNQPDPILQASQPYMFVFKYSHAVKIQVAGGIQTWVSQ